MTKNTKKAVWASALSIIMCLSLLIGTTFAWFTDTASTAVNKIQAGKLDVQLQYENNDGNWVDAEGKTLQFKVGGAIPAAGTQILWEPGCTYELPALRVVNKGDLALKYKVIITGINGDAKLNEAIEWKCDGQTLESEYEGKLQANAEGDAFVISGHMKEDAGNEYQGLSIDGIAITVVATQDTVETDSTDNQYDASAVLPVYAQTVGNITVATGSAQNDATVATEQTIGDSVMTVTYPNGAKLSTTGAIEGDKTTVKQELEYKGDQPSAAMGSVTIDGGKSVASYELTLPVANDNPAAVTVKINYTAGLTGVQIYHSGVLLTADANADGESATYNATSGVITLTLKHASPIDIVYNADTPKNAVIVNTLDELKAALEAGKEYIVIGANIDMKDSGGSEQVIVLNDCTIDLNGNKINGSVWSGSYISSADGTRLTLVDSGLGGEIYSKFRFTESGAMMQANAVTAWQHAVTINGGVYQSNNVVIVCQVQNTNAAEGVIINGGTFKGSNDLIEGVSLPGPVGGCVEVVIGTVTINGGTFEAAQYGSVIIAESGSSNCDSVVNIYGGSFSGACMFDFGADHSSKSIINVYGGDFTVKNPDGSAELPATSFAYDNVTHAALVNNDMFELNIMGGTFNMDPTAYVDTENYIVTNNANGTWTVTAKKA